MKLLLLIISVALLCIGTGFLFLYKIKNGGGDPWTWKLTPKEKVIANIATACVGVAIIAIWLNGYMG